MSDLGDSGHLEDAHLNSNNNNNYHNYRRDSHSSGISRVDPENEPAYSRLFIICGKSVTEEDLEREFKPLGNLQSLKIVRDKVSGESKGVAYVKYDKASTAAVAIELLNGKKIADDQSPLKVMIADAKGNHTRGGLSQSSSSALSRSNTISREPEDLPPRSRLFVICSKEFTEEDLIDRFKPFGDFESCKVIKDKQTNEHKGYAYAKFSKSSTAALAMEELNRSALENGLKLKALIADPKSKNKMENQSIAVGYPQMSVPPMPFGYPAELGPIPAYSLPQFIPRQRLFVVCHKSVTQDQLARLFSRFPGMEYCDLKKNKQTEQSKGFAYINYSSPQTAMQAKDQMDGYEFPYGNHLKVMFAEPLGMKNSPPTNEPPAISAIRDSFAQMMSYPPPGTMSYPPTPGPLGPGPSHVSAQSPVVASISLHNSGPIPAGGNHVSSQALSSEVNAQTNDRNFPEGSRLFIVLSKAVPDYMLQDVFSRYGALEYVRLQKDKNYGYAKYTTASAAGLAMQCLNNQDIQGQKITITIAHPPSDSRKRPRI